MKQKFVNPYNFIPLASKRAEGTLQKGENVGVIEYTITTKTPIFIPNTSTDAAFVETDEYEKEKKNEARKESDRHVSRDFFSYNELSTEKRYEDEYFEPVIPGSEIRGMIRNIYETLTDSCMSILNEETNPSRRSQEVFGAGLIKREKDGTLKLYEAVDCIYRTTDDFRQKEYNTDKYAEGQKVNFDWRAADRGRKGKPLIRKFDGPNKGYVLKGMKGPEFGKDPKKEKHNMHVFYLQKQKLVRELDVDDLKRLKKVISKYQTQVTSTKYEYEEYAKNLEMFVEGQGEEYFPVYYSVVTEANDSPLYLSPASITREVFNHTIGELSGDFTSCKVKEEACPACSLFGMLGKNNKNVIASLIRFTDATVVTKKENTREYYLPKVTLPELSGPKLQNVEFYLKKPKEAKLWTYDYYVPEPNKIKVQSGVLRGRKFYWHHPDVKLESVAKNNRNSTVRPLTQGITFKGKLYFDGISDTQLEQLVWIMNCGSLQENSHGNEDDGKIMYKIGTGKPLGLGSVELAVTVVKKREISIEQNQLKYTENTEKPVVVSYEEAGFSKEVKNDFLLITQFHNDLKNIHYPGGDSGEEGFKWYVKNHHTYKKNRDTGRFGYEKGMGQKRVQAKLVQSLPLLSEGLEQQAMETNTDTSSGNVNKKTQSRSQGKQISGVIKFYNEDRKYGFIRAKELDKDVHFGKWVLKEIDEAVLKTEVKVLFTYEKRGDKKYEATSLTLE